jgi:hypothetical protein
MQHVAPALPASRRAVVSVQAPSELDAMNPDMDPKLLAGGAEIGNGSIAHLPQIGNDLQ